MAKLGQAMGVNWGAELQADYVHAKVKNFGPAPFMPPFRVMARLTGERGPFDGRIEVEHAFAHDRTAPFETDTDGYTMVNAVARLAPVREEPGAELRRCRATICSMSRRGAAPASSRISPRSPAATSA